MDFAILFILCGNYILMSLGVSGIYGLQLHSFMEHDFNQLMACAQCEAYRLFILSNNSLNTPNIHLNVISEKEQHRTVEHAAEVH